MLAACLSAALLLSSTAFAALPEIMSLKDIRPGMRGTGYTVIDESGEIRPFEVQVVGILGDNSKMSSKRILVNLSGSLIEETGGAISGMSGSPIYFDGKLAGALSAGYRDMYPTDRIMLTPIEDMLKIWDYPDSRNKTSLKQLDLKKMQEEKEKFQAEQAAKEAEKSGKDKSEEEKAVGEEADTAKAEEAKSEDVKSEAPAEEKQKTADNAADTQEQPQANEAQEGQEPAENKADGDKGDQDKTEAKDDVEAEATTGEQAEDAVEECPEEEPAEAEPSADYKPKTAVSAQEGQSGSSVINSDDEDSEAPLEHKAVFFASGFGSKGLEFLQEKMSPLGIKVDYSNTWDNGSSMMQVRPNATLEPGSPVGVAMSIGDFTFGSLGTVTAVDDKRILAFGHSYTHRGNVNYFMTDASVISTIHGPTSGMKLGTVSGIIGRISQDRQDGIGGTLGQYPQTVPIIVTVHDKDTNRDITYNTMVAFDEDVVAAVAPAAVYSSIQSTLDRQDASTASLKFALRSNYGPDGLIERRNMFYDSEDVAKAAVSELTDVLNVILGNREKEPDMLDLKVDVTIDKGRKTALLVSAVPSKKEVLPGETITLDTTLKPYRGSKVKVEVPYTVPETQQPGELGLDVHGGGFVNVAKILLAQQQAAEAGVEMDQEPPVDVQLQDMLSSNCNNDIVVEATLVVPKTDAELKKAVEQGKKLAEKLAKSPRKQQKAQSQEKISNKVACDYIVENVIHTSVKVLEKK